jgi:polyphosphate kinase
VRDDLRPPEDDEDSPSTPSADDLFRFDLSNQTDEGEVPLSEKILASLNDRTAAMLLTGEIPNDLSESLIKHISRTSMDRVDGAEAMTPVDRVPVPEVEEESDPEVLKEIQDVVEIDLPEDPEVHDTPHDSEPQPPAQDQPVVEPVDLIEPVEPIDLRPETNVITPVIEEPVSPPQPVTMSSFVTPSTPAPHQVPPQYSQPVQPQVIVPVQPAQPTQLVIPTQGPPPQPSQSWGSPQVDLPQNPPEVPIPQAYLTPAPTPANSQVPDQPTPPPPWIVPPQVEALMQTTPNEADLPVDRYSDRELSWLAFNERVLDLAKDRKRIPLLERAKFLAIFSSNLDEFYMVRVAGLKRRLGAGLAQRGTSGLLPREVHEAILAKTRDLVTEQTRIFLDEVMPELAQQGILILRWPNLTDAEKENLTELFKDRIFPVLTPLAVDPSHPFPYISGLSLNLAVQLRNPQTGTRLFARIKVPNVLPRFIEVAPGRFVPLEDIISHHLDTIFTGMEITKYTIFRVTRNEDLEVEEDDAESILYALEKELLRRKVGQPPVRLEVEETIDPELLEVLTSELDVTSHEIISVRGPLDLTGLFLISDVNREDLKYPSFLEKTSPHLSEVETSRPADLFATLKKRDVLLHHPYDSFATSVQRFIEQAAADPQVLAIKQTLYRTSGDSPIIDALIEAARAGKQVLALVEIRARFDEAANIAWARKLEKSGVHVVYGLVGLKTHCKLSLVIRDEGEALRRYCHVGTGNYNPKTARLYEDMGLLTSNPVITDDVARLFNHLSGMTAESKYRRLLVSPNGIRTGIMDAIENEIRLHEQGTQGRIRIKVNSIVDEEIMDALYRASKAGVQVDLWVRGICALRGGVPGLSDNIRIRSILGRYLEHSRLYWFDNGGSPQVGLGSADLMHRNLDRRVEALVLLSNKDHISKIGSLFDLAFDEGTASWWLESDGWVQKTTDADGNPLVDIQEHLIHATSVRRTAV